MTAILDTQQGPCIMRTVSGATGATFETREYPLHVARYRSVIENRPSSFAQRRDIKGRYAGKVLA